MSIGERLKRIFSSPARTDAAPGIASETDAETTIDEQRIKAGGGGGGASPTTAQYGGLEASEAVEGELSEYEPPSD